MRWTLASLRHRIRTAACGACFITAFSVGSASWATAQQTPAAEQAPRENAKAEQRPGDRPENPAREPGERRGRQDRQGDRGRGPGTGGPGGPGAPGMFMARLPIMMALDADSDGVISTAEIEGAAAALKKLDKNSDGKLTLDELRPEGVPGFGGPGLGAPGFGPPGAVDPTEMVARVMNGDKNGDGFIDKEEAPEPMQANFARIDSDGDGKLSKEELTRMATQMSRRGGPRGDGPRGDGPRGDGPRGDGPRGDGPRGDGPRGDREGGGERPRRPTPE